MTHLLRITATLAILFCFAIGFTGCKKHHEEITPVIQPTPPTITSFTPVYGLEGSSITITGTHFSTTAASNTVTVHGVTATVTAATATSLTVTVPAGATSGFIGVTVATLTASSANPFEVLIDVPRTGLVAFYPFTGNTNDASGHSFNAVVMNHNGTGSPVAASDRFTQANHAYSFDGQGDYMRVADADGLRVAGSATWAYWVNLAEVKNSQITLAKAKYPDACNGYLFELGKDGTDATKSNIFLSVATGSEYYSNNNFTGSAVWVFIAVVKDGANSQTITYVNDGAGVHNDNVPALADCAADLLFGTHPAYETNINVTVSSFHGLLDDVTIYNRALSAAEVLQLYQQTVTKY